MYREIKQCRISEDKNLVSVLSLGEHEMTGVFPSDRRLHITKGPLELVWSSVSQLLQLKHSYSLKEMYGDNYGYRSGLNQSMVDHLSNIVLNLENRFELNNNDCVIDIGSNDATLLKAYQAKNIKRIGIDPTGIKFKDFYTKNISLIEDYFPSKDLNKMIGDSKIKIITSIAMFYDLEDPIAFAQSIHEILSKNGVWYFEQSYMPSMLRLNSYDTICHEHLEYYTIMNIMYILDRADLKIVDIQMNAINGGSFAVTAARKDSIIKQKDVIIHWLIEKEMRMGFNTLAPFKDFKERVFQHREELRALIMRLNDDGAKIFGYGASTKGNVVLQFCGFSQDQIQAIADVNPLKYGCYTPGTLIPIISEEMAKKLQPDYYLVLPWHFKDGILRREREFINKGGRFIFPFPEIEIVGA